MAGRKLSSYRGVRALVTGASSGIGRLLAQRLAAGGARVALAARRADELEALAAEIRSAGGEALVVPCDVGERASVEAACDEVIAAWGGVDLLVNNAGYGAHRTFLEWDYDDIERMMRVNYLGSVLFTKRLLPGMVERKKGWVVFVSSMAGHVGTPEEAPYAATKFALRGLAEGLSIEIEDAGVHVLTVCPGVIQTPFFDQEMLARMPPVALKQFVPVEGMVDAIQKALAKGQHHLTYPRNLAVAFVVKAIAPTFFRGQVKKNTFDALRKAQRAKGE
jgi:short-subunit dehydrogenase